MQILLPPLDAIKNLLKEPGMCYIAPGGKELYVSDPMGGIVLFTGPDFGFMSDDEISQYVIDQVVPKT